jgi:ribosomal protein S18 acetylase RimI-like enzyme
MDINNSIKYEKYDDKEHKQKILLVGTTIFKDHFDGEMQEYDLEYMLDDAIVAILDSEIIGFCMYKIFTPAGDSDNYNYISTISLIGVLEPFRKLKIGTELLTRTIQLFSENNPNKDIYLHVEVDTMQSKWYQRFGFKIVKVINEYYYNPYRNAFLMKYILSNNEKKLE